MLLARETPSFFRMYSARRKITLCELLSLARLCLDLRKGGNGVGRHLLAIGAKPRRWRRQYLGLRRHEQDWLVDDINDQETKLAESEESDNRRKELVDALSVLNERERRIFEALRLADDPIRPIAATRAAIRLPTPAQANSGVHGLGRRSRERCRCRRDLDSPLQFSSTFRAVSPTTVPFC